MYIIYFPCPLGSSQGYMVIKQTAFSLYVSLVRFLYQIYRLTLFQPWVYCGSNPQMTTKTK